MNIKSIKIYQDRNERLKRMGFSNYKEYLNSEDWVELKERISKKTKKYWNYCFCCESKNYLVPHHLTYKNIAFYRTGMNLSRIVMACWRCHQEIHRLAYSDDSYSIKEATKLIRRKYRGKISSSKDKHQMPN